MKQIQAGQIWLTRGSCHGIFAVSWRLLIKCLLRSDWLNLSVRSRPESVDLCDPKGCILEDDHRFASDQVRSMQRLRWLMYWCTCSLSSYKSKIRQAYQSIDPAWTGDEARVKVLYCIGISLGAPRTVKLEARSGGFKSPIKIFTALKLLFQAARARHASHAWHASHASRAWQFQQCSHPLLAHCDCFDHAQVRDHRTGARLYLDVNCSDTLWPVWLNLLCWSLAGLLKLLYHAHARCWIL